MLTSRKITGISFTCGKVRVATLYASRFFRLQTTVAIKTLDLFSSQTRPKRMGTKSLSTTNTPRSNTICLTGRQTTIPRSPTTSSDGSCRACENGSPNSSTLSSARSTTPLKAWRRPPHHRTPPTTRTRTIKRTIRQSSWKMRKAPRRTLLLLLLLKKRITIRKPLRLQLLRRRKSRRVNRSKKRSRSSLRVGWTTTSARMTKSSRLSSASTSPPSQHLQAFRMQQQLAS